MKSSKILSPVVTFFVLCLIVVSFTSSSFAQAGRGGLNGVVADETGALIPHAHVVITNKATGVKHTTQTSRSGFFSFVALDPGIYQVTVSMEGFASVTRNNLRVTVDQETTADLNMHVGKINDVVTVSAGENLIETNNSTVGQLISSETMDRVPLLTRDVFQLVQLSAGVTPANGTPNASDTMIIFNARPGIDVSSYTINGSLQGSIYYMVDGAPFGVAENNISAILPAFQIPEEAIAEYRVETQNAPTTYQSGAAGVISLATKSGANQFHGSAFGYFRPNAVAANDYFNKLNNPGSGTPAFHRYQEGGSFSGPFIRDKFFFFGDYEATQQSTFDGEYFTVPTDAERVGDFTADTGNFNVYNPLVPDSNVIDPITGYPQRQQFVGTNSGPGCSTPTLNCIPTADQNQTGLLFLAQFPHANTPGTGFLHQNNYYNPGLDPLNARKFDVRGDFNLGDKQKLFARYSYEHLFFSNALQFGADNIFDALYYQNYTIAYNTIVADDITLSPTSVLQLRYNFTRHHEDQTGDPRQLNYDNTTLGFPSSLVDQQLYTTLPIVGLINSGLNSQSIVGGTANYDTFLFASENSDATATYTKTFGRHEMNIGGEYEKLYMNIGQPPAPSGAYYFDNTPTSSTTTANDSSDMAALLIGMGQVPGAESGNTTPNFTLDVYAALASPYYAGFFQDAFHISKKLTLNYGVRWDIFGGRTERHNRQEYFSPTVGYTAGGLNLNGGEVFANSSNRSPFTTNLKDFAPRVSLAWQPVNHAVVHAAFGIYYGPSSEMVASPSFNTDGFSSTTNWNPTQYNADGNTIFNSTPDCVNNNDVSGCYALNNPFPDGLIEPTGSSLGPQTYIGGTLNTVQRTNRTVTTYNYNFGVEYEFPYQIVFSASYVGSRGLFLPIQTYDANQLTLGQIASNGNQFCLQPSSTGCTMIPNVWAGSQPSTNVNYGAATVPMWVGLQEYPQFGNGNYGYGNGVLIHGYPGGDSEYNSLQAKLEKHLSNHLATLLTFTWGKIMTDDSGSPLSFIGYHVAAPQDYKNLNLEHSIGAQDVKLQFNWQLSYDLPIGQGRAINTSGALNHVVGGWTINTIVYMSSGVPIAAPTGTGDLLFNQRVDMNCNPGAGAAKSVNQWFNYNCFSQPVNPLIAGSAPAYISGIRTNGAHDLDVSLYKNFKIRAEMNLRFEVAAYNFTNSVQFGYPNVFWNPTPNPTTMAGFGQVTSDVNLPRQIQFGAKFTF